MQHSELASVWLPGKGYDGLFHFNHIDRTPKGTQGVVTNFEIFRMREKQVPVDVVEMKGKFLGWGAPIAVAPLVVLFTCGLQLSSQAWPGWPAD